MNTTQHVSGPLLLTVAEAAEELRVSKSTILRMVGRGDLPAVHLEAPSQKHEGRKSRRLRISRDALTAYIAANTRQAS